jgi:hypothetical protein
MQKDFLIINHLRCIRTPFLSSSSCICIAFRRFILKLILFNPADSLCDRTFNALGKGAACANGNEAARRQFEVKKPQVEGAECGRIELSSEGRTIQGMSICCQFLLGTGEDRTHSIICLLLLGAL